jgi:drug/metabolite transporter (DMT)-like permease
MAWLFFALLAAAAVTTESIADKGVLRRENPTLFVALVMILTGLIALPFIWIVDWSKITLPAFAWIVLTTGIISTAFLCWAKSMKKLELSVMAPMTVVTPGIVAVLATMLLNENLNRMQVWGIVLLILGGYCLQLKRGEDWFYPIQRVRQSRDLHFLYAAIFLYPIASIMARFTFTRLHIEPYDYLVLVRIIAATGFALYLHFRLGGIQKLFTHVPKHKGILFWIASLDMLASGAIGMALAGAYAAKALAIQRLSAIFTTIVGGELYHENHLVKKAIACAVMVFGAMLVALG